MSITPQPAIGDRVWVEVDSDIYEAIVVGIEMTDEGEKVKCIYPGGTRRFFPSSIMKTDPRISGTTIADAPEDLSGKLG